MFMVPNFSKAENVNICTVKRWKLNKKEVSLGKLLTMKRELAKQRLHEDDFNEANEMQEDTLDGKAMRKKKSYSNVTLAPVSFPELKIEKCTR